METRTLASSDGTLLSYSAWPVRAPRGAALVSHGLGEHGGRYAELAAALGERGIATFAVDHRGHGRSAGPRGHAGTFGILVEDLERSRAHAFADLPAGTPAFLVGHSMGALVGIHHLAAHPEHRWAGVVLSAPLLRASVRVPAWKEALSRALSRIAPALPFDNEIRIEDLSSAPGYREAYEADPLMHRRITPGMYAGMRDAMTAARDAVPGVGPPLLVVVPDDDRVVDPAAAVEWSDAWGAELRRYPGFRHEALNEADRHRVIADILAWIEERVSAGLPV